MYVHSHNQKTIFNQFTRNLRVPQVYAFSAMVLKLFVFVVHISNWLKMLFSALDNGIVNYIGSIFNKMTIRGGKILNFYYSNAIFGPLSLL